MVLPALLLLSSFLLSAPDPAAPPRPQEAGFSLLYWNQNGGNAAGDAAVDVSPVTREPVERWRRSVGEPLGSCHREHLPTTICFLSPSESDPSTELNP